MASLPRKPAVAQSEVDKRWFDEWFNYGMRMIEASLANHAEFDRRYPQEQPDDGRSSPQQDEQ